MSAARSRAAAAGALALALSAGYLAQGTFAAGTPANKVAASGSTHKVFGPGTKVTLLSETVKINNPTDLIIEASAECSIITQVSTTGTDKATATASIQMWVEIDGTPVPVAENDTSGGRVTYCDRTHEQQTTFNQDDQDDTIRTYLSTKNANDFNWLALNVGTNYPGTDNNVHKIVLYGTLVTQNLADGTFADAVVGNRTLILEPVKAAHGETVTELS